MAQVLRAERSTSYYDAVAARYAVYTSQFDMDGILGDFFATVRQGDVVLDVGCGAGRDLGVLQEVSRLAIGLDLSRGLLNEARRRTCAPAIQADAAYLPLATASVDRVIAVASLHHLAGPLQVRALREISRVLRPAGEAFVTLKVGSDVLRDVDRETGLERFFHLVPPATFLGRALGAGLRPLCSSESTVDRRGTWQRWFSAWLRRRDS